MKALINSFNSIVEINTRQFNLLSIDRLERSKIAQPFFVRFVKMYTSSIICIISIFFL